MRKNVSSPHYDPDLLELVLSDMRLLRLFPSKNKKEPPKFEPKQPKVLDIFNPQTFEEYIGQNESKELAKIMVQASIKENKPLPNAMLVGEYGTGKTALARIIMRERGLSENLVDGSSVNRMDPLPTGTLIIDEIHNLEPQICDTLNLAIDQGRIHIIGCTTDPGKLPSAFRSRFRTFFLQSYAIEDLQTIISKICTRKGVPATRESLWYIAERSRSNARQAIIYLDFVFDVMSVKNQKTLTITLAQEALSKFGVDDDGLTERDRLYLRALPPDRAVGLQYLAAVTGINEKTIEEEIEPYLMRSGLVDRLSRGRIRGPKASIEWG